MSRLSGHFRDTALSVGPPWLHGENTARYLYACGTMADALAEQNKIGCLQRFPQRCQPEALPLLGRDRQIIRGELELDDPYAARLRTFRATWATAGGAPVLLQQLWAALAPGGATKIRYVTQPTVTQADWWTIDGAGLAYWRQTPGNWNWDSLQGQCRFWIIVYRADLTIPLWGSAGNWGATPARYWALGTSPRSWLTDAYAIISQFKAAGSALGPWDGFGGGLIATNAATAAPSWGGSAANVFGPTWAGAGIPNGLWASDVTQRTPLGSVYLSGLGQ